jgi:hypothetical protein
MRFKAAPAKTNYTQVAEDNQGMKRPRLTISGMMVVVASVALGIAAYVALDLCPGCQTYLQFNSDGLSRVSDLSRLSNLFAI